MVYALVYHLICFRKREDLVPVLCAHFPEEECFLEVEKCRSSKGVVYQFDDLA